MLGINLVKKYPDLFYAYVGIGQIVNMVESEKLSFKYTMQKAIEDKNEKAVKELKSFENTYPEISKKGMKDLMKQRQWLVYYEGVMFGKKNYSDIFTKIKDPEHNLFDFYQFFSGMMFSMSTNLWFEMLEKTDFIRDANELKVLVYFVEGKYDYNVPFELTEKYYNVLKSPKKELIWFEKSAHMPPFEEPEKFNDVMVNKILKETYSQN